MFASKNYKNKLTGTHKLRGVLIVSALFASAATMAQVQVNSSGVANYSVNIAVPPGVAGLQPTLAIQYTGGAQSSPAGFGWAVGGVSVISRCSGTRAIDGAGSMGGVQFKGTDKLCLDGQRLIPTDANGNNATVGASTADANGLLNGAYSEFRTENDSYSRIRAYGLADGTNLSAGPAYFRVWTKDGHILEYGAGPASDSNTNALIKASYLATDSYQYAQSWALARSSDIFGNFVDYKYTQRDIAFGSTVNGQSNGHEWRLAEAQYSGNKVVFSYSDRPAGSREARESYTYGSKNLAMSVLNSVTTYVNSANPGQLGAAAGAVPVKTYKLNQSEGPVTSRLRLNYVQECAGGASSTNCMPYSTFTYANGDLSAGAKYNLTFNFNLGTYPLNGAVVAAGNPAYQYSTLVGDFTGDGKADILRIDPWDYHTNELWASNGDSSFTKVPNSVTLHGPMNLDTEWLGSKDGCYSSFVGDFNGDGRPDIFRYSAPGMNPSGKLANGTTTCPYASPSYIFLNNGGGAFTRKTVTGVTPSMVAAVVTDSADKSTKSWTEGANFYVIDVDGDGIPDIVTTRIPAVSGWVVSGGSADPCASTTCTRVYKGDGQGGFTEMATNIGNVSVYDNPMNTGLHSPHVFDIDGDGRADIFINNDFDNKIPASLNKYAVRSRGDGNFDVLTGPACPAPKDGLCTSLLIDYNGSGKPSRLVPGPTAADNRLYATGTRAALDAHVSNTDLTTDTNRILNDFTHGTIVGDFDGDGREDILRWGQTLVGGSWTFDGKLYLSRGDGTFATSPADYTYFQSNVLASADFYGDGSLQLLANNTNGSNALLKPAAGAGLANDYLAAVTAPTGEKISITLAPLSNAGSDNGVAHYVSDAGTANAGSGTVMDLSIATPVVTKLETPDGIGGSATTFYYYRGLKADSKGRGLGYRQVLTQSKGKDGAARTDETTYAQVAPYIGQVLSSKTYRSDISSFSSATLLNSTTTVFCDQQAGAGAATAAIASGVPCAPVAVIKRPYSVLTTSTGVDLNGAPLPTTTVQTAVTASGDPATVTSKVTLSGSPADTYTKVISNSYFADNTGCSDIATCSWILGRTSLSTVHSTVPSTLPTVSVGSAPNAAAIDSGSNITPALDFGPVAVGISKTLSATLSNANSSSTSVSLPPIVSGSGFSYASTTCSSSLPSGGNCNVSVTFTPVAAGPSTGALNLTTGQGARTVALSGSGSQPSLSKTSVDNFTYNVPQNTGSGHFVAVQNNGAVPVTINSVSTTASSGAFAVTTSAVAANPGATYCSPGAVLEVGQSCGVWATADGAAGTTATGTVTFNTTAGNVTYSGSFNVQGLAYNATTGGTVPITYGSDTTGTLYTLTIGNPTAFNFYLPQYAVNGGIARMGRLTGADASLFRLTGTTCTGTLNAGASCTLTIAAQYVIDPRTYTAAYQLNGTFQQAADGAAGAWSNGMSLANMGTTIGDVYVAQVRPVDITAQGARVVANAAPQNFGGVVVGSSVTSPVFTLTNTGNVTANLVFTPDVSAPFSFAPGTNCPARGPLAAGASCNYSITAAPTATGIAYQGFSVCSQNGCLNYGLLVTGTTVNNTPGFGQFVTADPSLNLGNIPAYSGSNAVLSYKNIGAQSVTVGSAGLMAGFGTGQNGWVYTDAANPATCYPGNVLSPSQTCVMLVGFNLAPGQPGNANVGITFSNGPADTRSVTAVGQGLAVSLTNNSPTVRYGASSDIQVVVTNPTFAPFKFGTSPITFSNWTGVATNGTAVGFVGWTCPAELAPGASCTATLRWTSVNGVYGPGSLDATLNGEFAWRDGTGPANRYRGDPHNYGPYSVSGTLAAPAARMEYAGAAPGLNLGSVPAFSGSNPWVTYANTGDLPLTVQALDLLPGTTNGAGIYTNPAQSSTCFVGNVIAPGGSCFYLPVVALAPGQAGTMNVRLTMSNGWADTETVTAVGQGLIFTTQNDGVTVAAGTSANAVITMTNPTFAPFKFEPANGRASLEWGGWTGVATNSQAAGWSANTCGAVLEPGASCSVSLQWSALPGVSGPGSLNFTVSGEFAWRDGTGPADRYRGSPFSHASVGLSATLAAAPSVATLTSTPNQGFGAGWYGQSANYLNWTYRNDGANPLTLTSPTLAAPLSVSANNCTNIASGASCTITVQNSWNNDVPKPGGQSFVPSGATTPPAAANAAYTVNSAIPVWATPNLSFGSVSLGQSATLPVTLYNYGASVPYNWAVSPLNNLPADFTVDLSGCASVAPGVGGGQQGGSCVANVTFKPTVAGARGGSNVWVAAASYWLNGMGATFSGTGVAVPPASFTPSTANASPTATFTFTNPVGNSAVTITGMQISTSSNSKVQLLVGSNSCTGSLAGGGSCTVMVNFTPSGLACGAVGNATVYIWLSDGRIFQATVSGTNNNAC